MKRSGQILIQTLVLSALAVVFIGVLVNLATFNINSAKRAFNSELAFQIAEGGIEYYRWHLAHAPNDFQDGTGQPGPYTHDFKDKDGNVIGQFVLDITAPSTGSTVVTILSTGTVTSDASAIRKVRAKLAIPSLAKYAVAANDVLRFGLGTVVSGPIHSNDGIRFDGFANNIITSAKAQYDDPDHSGGEEYGVHTHANAPPGQGSVNDSFRPQEAPPGAVQNRSDVFGGGRQFPVPAVDFTGLTATLAQLKTSAWSAAGRYFAPSGALGYEVVVRTNGMFDVYKVTSLKPAPSGCTNSQSANGWGIWSIAATTTVGTYAYPSNGIIFFEDNIWVSGKVSGARVNIVSGRFPENPSTDSSITVNGDLLYTNYDGQDVIGLIAQNNINVGLYSEDDLRIDAALIAKNGRAGRYYYRKPSGQNYCGATALRSTLTLYGTITSNRRYGFSWVCGANYCSGYETRNILYDANLLYSPPPSFPRTSDQYSTISWEEVK